MVPIAQLIAKEIGESTVRAMKTPWWIVTEEAGLQPMIYTLSSILMVVQIITNYCGLRSVLLGNTFEKKHRKKVFDADETNY